MIADLLKPNGYSSVYALSSALTNFEHVQSLEREFMRGSHVYCATPVNSHGLLSSFDRVDKSWTKLSFKSGHSARIQPSYSFDPIQLLISALLVALPGCPS